MSGSLARGEKVKVGFVIDGSDPSVASTALSAAQAVGQAHSIEVLQQALPGRLEAAPGIDVHPRVWYNPNMESTNFMIPGLIGMILQMLTMMLTAMAIVREREQGTIEQLIVTPIRPLELIVGKVAPYVVISFWDLLEILFIGVWWFEVPIHGSVPLLLGLSSLFLADVAGFGHLDLDGVQNPTGGDDADVLYHAAIDFSVGVSLSDRCHARCSCSMPARSSR